jgi:hypothetical protein
MEDRIKEQMCLFADPLSTEEMKGNQLRLYFCAMAYTLMEALRRLGLHGTGMGPGAGRLPAHSEATAAFRDYSLKNLGGNLDNAMMTIASCCGFVRRWCA